MKVSNRDNPQVLPQHHARLPKDSVATLPTDHRETFTPGPVLANRGSANLGRSVSCLPKRSLTTYASRAAFASALILVAPSCTLQIPTETELAELRASAEQGNEDAQFYLGVRYSNGQGILQDHDEAIRWFEHGAEQEDTRAMASLGLKYQEGVGVRQDYVQAHLWTNLAASRRTGETQKLLVWYREHAAKQLTPDQLAEAHRLAREWNSAHPRNLERIRDLRSRIEEGDSNALLSLGFVYGNGQDVPQDYVQAHLWTNIAASRLIGRDRDQAAMYRNILANRMTPESLNEAKRLEREWSAAHPFVPQRPPN